MSKEITYEEAQQSTDLETLLNYCIQGAINNIEVNGGSLKDWDSGCDIVDVYLEHNDVLDDSQRAAISGMMDNFLKLNSELDFDELCETIE